MEDVRVLVIVLALLGLVGGLALLGRGLRAYRRAGVVAGIGTSRIATLAAGEIRLAGVVEADILTLVSPLQSVPCVYYRARIRAPDDARVVFDEERAVGFRLRDASGAIRVFARGARWDVPLRFDATSDPSGGDPPGLNLNAGASQRPAVEDRDAQVAALLTVRRPSAMPGEELDGGSSIVSSTLGAWGLAAAGPPRRDYDEWRLEPGDTVTLVGSALPFSDLDDSTSADRLDPTVAFDDPEVAMNVAEAREAGILAATPEDAWGNAAIPGFAIGRPARAPALDPGADVPALANPADVAAAEARFEIPAGELVVAVAPDHPLAILAGTPGEARQREDTVVLLGLAGAALAIAAVTTLALTLPGHLR